jgi:hypothetical protein
MGAETVRGHRCEIISIGFRCAVTMLRAGRGSRLPSRLPRRPPILSGRIAVASAVLLAVNGWGGARRSPGRRISAAVRSRWLAFQRPGGADELDQEFIGADEADRWPGRDHRSDGTV